MAAKPKLVVFDLDFTLWPQHVESTVRPPLKKDSDGKIVDSRGKLVEPFPEANGVLKKLKNEGYKIAAASRTTAPPVADSLIKLLDWDKYFDFRQIYPGCKKTHFQRLKDDSGIEYADMIFFDDDMRNIDDISPIVVSIYVTDGMTLSLFEEGLKKWRQNKK